MKPNIFLRRRTLLAGVAAAVGLGCGTQALAQPELVDFKVVDRESGQPLRVWRHHGRFFVAGEPGRRYALRVTNHTGGRVLVVMSVDGINVLTGETAGPDQRGYVFDPYETWDLPGWRKSDTEVAQFVFAPLPQSYAARTGRPADVGVIGIAAFREKIPPPPPPMPLAPAARVEPGRGIYERTPPIPQPAPPPAPSLTILGGANRGDGNGGATFSFTYPPPPARDDKLGTGHGARERSVVQTVDFERATDAPEMVQQVEYDTYDNLVAAGVIRMADTGHRPRPFPAGSEGQGYVPDPPPGR